MKGVEIRHMVPTDMAFIKSTWLKHYKSSSYFALRIRKSTFFHWHDQIAERILAKSSAVILVACAEADPNIILGFLVAERGDDEPIVHYLFVKEELRRMGIGRMILKSAEIDPRHMIFTHWTYDVNDLIREFPRMVYDPYRI